MFLNSPQFKPWVEKVESFQVSKNLEEFIDISKNDSITWAIMLVLFPSKKHKK
ncbi:MAG: hypothetical protein ACI9LN_003651 [Saprospiraceae bacterium]|jgi:hypothetical protein